MPTQNDLIVVPISVSKPGGGLKVSIDFPKEPMAHDTEQRIKAHRILSDSIYYLRDHFIQLVRDGRTGNPCPDDGEWNLEARLRLTEAETRGEDERIVIPDEWLKMDPFEVGFLCQGIAMRLERKLPALLGLRVVGTLDSETAPGIIFERIN